MHLQNPKLTFLRLLAIVAFAFPARSQDNATAEPIEYPLAQELELTKQYLALKKGETLEVPAAEADRGIFVISEGSFIGRKWSGNFGSRTYLVCSLRLANLTPDPIKFVPATMRLSVDGQELKHQKWAPLPSQSGAYVRGRPLTIKTPDQVDLEPGEVKEVIGAFPDMPNTGLITNLRLTVGGLPQPVAIDLMAQAKRELELTSRRTGPRQCLGVLTINRRLDSVSANCVVSEMEKLLAAGSSRLLIRWGKNATVPDSATRRWLSNAARNSGSGTVVRSTSGFPTMPPGIAELHLSPAPSVLAGTTRMSSSNMSTNLRVHNSDEAAFVAALQTAYARLPLAELVRDTEAGTPLIRAAAIQGGTGRLPERLIPMLLELSHQEPSHLRSSAVIALAAFPSKEAVQRVAEVIPSAKENLLAEAVRGLRDSRFPLAQETLRDLLKTLDPKPRAKAAEVLLASPRPEWRELFYEYAKAGNLSALRALGQIGHPKLPVLLKDLLQHSSAAIRKEAFNSLANNRRDPESTAIALEYTLQFIKKTYPTPAMLNLLRRQGSREATDSLIAHYLAPGANRRLNPELLRAIVATGDESLIPFLMEQYTATKPAMDSPQKQIVLNALQNLRAPGLTKLAIEALDDPKLILTAKQILLEDASPEAVLAIGDELLSRESTPKFQNADRLLIDALATIATPPARRVLRLLENEKTKSDSRRRQAGSKLDNLVRTSPAGPLHQAAGQLVDEGKLQEAEVKFAKALELDPGLAEIYVSRGHMKGRDKRRAEAVKDYDKALEIDPLHPIATSLKAICIVVLGDVEGGLQMVEDNRKTFYYDSLFNYNAACAYGQAIIVTSPSPENLEKIAHWKLKSLEYLEHYANKLTPLQDDGELIRDDPDLAPLRELDRFKRVLESREKPSKPEDAEDDG